MSSNDSPKHKLGHKNKLKANQCSKSKSQNVSQLSLHHFIPKCALAFHHKSISLLSSYLKLCEKNRFAKIYFKYKITVKM